MCGVIGIVATTGKAVATAIYDALTIIQHRGQDAAGIATFDKGRLNQHRGNGLVRQVFATKHMIKLTGDMGVGHVRYPTAGTLSSVEAQPFYVNSPYGIALAHNGNLTNTEKLKKELFETDLRQINTNSDSEVLLNVLAHELSKSGKHRIDDSDIFSALARLYKRVNGAYAVVAMVTGYGLIGFRDPYGIRPLILGRRKKNSGNKYMLASESAALTALGYDIMRDVAPGEAVIINRKGEVFFQRCCPKKIRHACIFEYVYFARPDSVIDGISVYQARLRMGERLADRIRQQWQGERIDVVIPIPDTSRAAALQLASKMNIKFREGFVKNRYIARTFIMPAQKERKKSVKHKLSAIAYEFKNKNVLLVDDSIVRGTTSKQIVQMAREMGANKVFFASAAPPVRYPNVYGIDLPNAKAFVAHQRDVGEVCQAIGADRLIFQCLEDLVWAVQTNTDEKNHFDMSCFDGHYITGDISAQYLTKLADTRREKTKHALLETS